MCTDYVDQYPHRCTNDSEISDHFLSPRIGKSALLELPGTLAPLCRPRPPRVITHPLLLPLLARTAQVRFAPSKPAPGTLLLKYYASNTCTLFTSRQSHPCHTQTHPFQRLFSQPSEAYILIIVVMQITHIYIQPTRPMSILPLPLPSLPPPSPHLSGTKG